MGSAVTQYAFHRLLACKGTGAEALAATAEQADRC